MHTPSFEATIDAYYQIENSERFQSNKAKEKPLNTVVEMILDELEVIYEDLTSHNNFIGSAEDHEADYKIPQLAVIENKNWDCCNHKGYTVTMQKAKTQIFSRFTPYLNIPIKLLIISKPKWGSGVKQWLEANGITIIEIGYQVNRDNLWQAYQQLKNKILSILNCGYQDITIRIECLLSRIRRIIKLFRNILAKIKFKANSFQGINREFGFRSKKSLESRQESKDIRQVKNGLMVLQKFKVQARCLIVKIWEKGRLKSLELCWSILGILSLMGNKLYSHIILF